MRCISRFPRSLFTKNPCARPREQAHLSQDGTPAPPVQQLSSQSTAHASNFGLDELPLELLSEILACVVRLSLQPYLRKACPILPQLLSLRLVNRTWAIELSRALHQQLTFPHLPRDLLSRRIALGTPSNDQRRAFLASALYNSAASLHHRHLHCTLIRRLNACVRLVEAVEGPYSPARSREVMRMLSIAATHGSTSSPQDVAARADRLTKLRLLERMPLHEQLNVSAVKHRE